MNAAPLAAPIFFIGMPRSGTTIVFEAFAQHEALAWLSNYSQRFPELPWLNAVRRLHDNALLRLRARKKQYQRVPPGNSFMVMPNEAYAFWDRHTGEDFSFSFLADRAAAPETVRRVRRACESTVRAQGRARLATKLTGPPRVRYLLGIFPDARFVHVVRDGYAVVHSLLRVPFWRAKGGFDGPFWKGGLDDDAVRRWRDQGADPALITAMQWRRVLEQTRSETAGLPPAQYAEVRYEDFVANPHQELRRLYAHTGLGDSPQAHALLNARERLRNMNDKYRREWPAEILARLGQAMEPLLSEYGYAR